MRLGIFLSAAQILLASSNARIDDEQRPRRRQQRDTEKGKYLRSSATDERELRLHSRLSPPNERSSAVRKLNKSKIARVDNGKRDIFVPPMERAGDGTSFEYSTSTDGVDVSVNVNVNVQVNTNGAGSSGPRPPSPQPPPLPTPECTQWDISYVTEIKQQYYYYQYYATSSNSWMGGMGKSGKSGGKSGKSLGKSGKSKGKSDKIMMKEVPVKKQVKTCVSTTPPLTVVTPSPLVSLFECWLVDGVLFLNLP
ncbi:hypothetical protein HJC23_010681 [Cyclotella cryptica]|uniref:WW domain-containing protein n=1 Tax=Cyclotella cryptica TaxID=29204 RepID=A0ABD3P966_9STRA